MRHLVTSELQHNTLTLTAQNVYDIAKQKDAAIADYNYDGKVDLSNEMAFGHAYYASSFDKGVGRLPICTSI